MKKLLVTTLIVMANICAFTSCTDDDDSHAKATMTFIGTLTRLNYTLEGSDEMQTDESSQENKETEDVFDYTDFITEAFETLELIGPKSAFEETAKVDVSSTSYAESVCAAQATEKIQNRLNALSIDDVKAVIFNAHKAVLQQLGFNTAAEIPFATLSAEFSYYYSTAANDPLVFTKIF